MEELEKGQILLGTTGLEDKLQENVPKCIEEFRRAEIKVWMITGDKLETAESVGISCRLLQNEEKRLFLTAGNNEEETLEKAKFILDQIRGGETVHANNSNNIEERKVDKENSNIGASSSENLRNGKDFYKHGEEEFKANNELSLEEKKNYVMNLVYQSGMNHILKKSPSE